MKKELFMLGKLLPLLFLSLAAAGAADAGRPEDFTPAASIRLFEDAINQTLAFLTRPEVIDPAGGGRLRLHADGENAAEVKATDQPHLTHIQKLRAHAAAIPRTADDAERARLRRQYDSGFDFLLQYRDEKIGLFRTALNSGGPVRPPEITSADQFHAIGVLAEIADVLCDRRALDLAGKTFDALDRFFHDDDHGGYFANHAPETPNRAKQLDGNLQGMLVLARLLKVRPDATTHARLQELFEILSSVQIRHPSGFAYRTITADWHGRPNDLPADQQVSYGQQMELISCLAEAAKILRVPPEKILPSLRELADRVIAYGITPGGEAIPCGPFDRPGEAPPTLSRKNQLEAMNMLLVFYDYTGEDRYFELFQRVAAGSFHLFAKPGDGRMLQFGEIGLPRLRRHRDGWRPPRQHQLKLPQRAIQISLGFPYNNQRSAASLVSEAAANGYDTIFLILKENQVLPEGLVEEAKKQGLQVYGSFFGPGTFMPDRLFPPESKEWRMEFTAPRGNRYFSYVHAGYRQWWKEYLQRLYDSHPFDGFVFYESYYGTRAGRLAANSKPYFGDVSPGFVRHFQRATGHASFPDFTDPDSPDYYRTNSALYNDYVEYRIRSIVDFHREIWDGEGGLRTLHPEVTFATWTIALAGDGAIDDMREYEAQDGARLVAELHPDYHFFQSHWPDWLPEKQSPLYVKEYAPYVKSVRDAFPALPLAVQGDFASTTPYRRSPEWVKSFDAAAAATGFQFTVFYELSVRYNVYFAAPRVAGGFLRPDGSGRIVFDQVISKESARSLIGREIEAERTITEVAVDGNLLDFRLDGPLSRGKIVLIPVGGIADEPELRVKMPQRGRGEVNIIPAGEFCPLEVTEKEEGNHD